MDLKEKLQELSRGQIIAIVVAVACFVALLAFLFMTFGSNETEELDFKGAEKKTPEVKSFYWPLTNVKAPDGDAVKRRPISMKIENSDNARPQSGLIDADIVYETEVEGGITRFHVLFQKDLPEIAGPLRSARTNDVWVVSQWDSYLLYSGAADNVYAELAATGIDMISEGRDDRVWERVSWRFAPHNLYVRIVNVPDVVPEYDVDLNSWEERGLVFEKDSAMPPAPTVSFVTVPFQAQTAGWEWSSASRKFLRYQNGEQHTDYVSGEQLFADNVVILWANYADFNAGGLATIFKHGTQQEGTWTTAPGQPPLLKDVNGKAIEFTAGKTWFEVVPLDTQIDVVLLDGEM